MSRAKRPYRLGLVVPRFGEEIWGGAELLGRWLADRLAGAGHTVEIFTTCAVDHHAWTNELPAGTEQHGDLLVRRYPLRPRDLGIHGELSRAIQFGQELSREEELLWLRHGASSADMEDDIAARGHTYDAILAMPYLFGTTYFAHAAAPESVVLIPCLHDESYARLKVIGEMLRDARAIFFNTGAEARLAQSIAGDIAPWAVVGGGVELPEAREGLPIPRAMRNRPSLLYVGRREGGKNTPLLIDYFMRYKSRRPSDLMLVFVGSGEVLPLHPDIFELEPKWGTDAVFRTGTVMVAPSTNESFSFILLEAWNAKRPALVNGKCDVTREHCERSNGGLWFTSYAEFEEVLDRMLSSPDLLAELGRNGYEYVRREYTWDAVLRRFDDAMDLVFRGPSSQTSTRRMSRSG